MSISQEVEKKVIEQERFYQDRYFQLVLLTLFLVAFIFGLIGLILLLRNLAVPPPVYFVASEHGELIAESPLDEKGIAVNELLNWVNAGMMASNTFNFINYTAVLNDSSIYYTKEGYDSYKNALTTANIIDKVVQKKLILKAIPRDAPQILLEKPLAGRYMWKIKLPMQFRYRNVTTDMSDLVEITLIVMRVPTVQSPNGVSILKYDLEVKGRV